MFVVNSYDFRLENWLLDQLIIPLLVLVFIRIIFHIGKRNSVLVTHGSWELILTALKEALPTYARKRQ